MGTEEVSKIGRERKIGAKWY